MLKKGYTEEMYYAFVHPCTTVILNIKLTANDDGLSLVNLTKKTLVEKRHYICRQ